MFARITSVGRLAVLLALALSVGAADAKANLESRREPDVTFDRYWQEPEEPEDPGSDLLFYRELIAGQKGECKPPATNPTRLAASSMR